MGRPKGSRNRATIAKQFAKSELAKHVTSCQGLVITELEGVIRVILQQAMEGCRQSQKMLLDRGLPMLRAREGEDTERGQINITINGTSVGEPFKQPGLVIDGEAQRSIPSAVTKTTFN